MEEDPEVLEAVLSDWTEAHALESPSGRSAAMKNLGFLRTFQKRERMGLNPQTGTEVLIPARTVLLMQPSNTLKRRVSNYGELESTPTFSAVEVLAEFPDLTEHVVAEAGKWNLYHLGSTIFRIR